MCMKREQYNSSQKKYKYIYTRGEEKEAHAYPR